ncbi:MAG: DUF4491 family protein [Duncaniella sp.]|nr:DUF4491 family protein [Duncaniella sp.]
MTQFLINHNLAGIAIGLATFLIIGLFHPLVIKGEYYYGRSIRIVFGLAGIAFLASAWMIDDIFWSALCGVTSFSCFWSIKEVDEQVERVRKGWFPENPNKKEKKFVKD